MVKRATVVVSAASAVVLLLVGTRTWADGSGTADDAKAMLARAVAAINADEPKALDAFSRGADGFRDRDLYVFCARRNGRVDAHIDPTQIGRNLKDVYDINGVAFGQEMMAVAEAGNIKGVAYMWPKPGTKVPTHKVAYVTRIKDQICGVGFYQ
jgi:hypothetical protein